MAEVRGYRDKLGVDLEWHGPLTSRRCTIGANGTAYLDPIDVGRHLEAGILEEISLSRKGTSVSEMVSAVALQPYLNVCGEDLEWGAASGRLLRLPKDRGGFFAPGDVTALVKAGKIRATPFEPRGAAREGRWEG